MIQEVKYSGIAAVPDPHSCPDGQLDLALNLLNEDGAIRPIPQPSQQFRLGQGCKPLALHESANFHNIIFLDDACSLCWQPVTESCTSINGQSQEIAFALTPGAEIKSAHPMGNLLIVSASDSLHYFIFRAGAYVYLGTRVPDISMRVSTEETNRYHRYLTTHNARVDFDTTVPEDDHLRQDESTVRANNKRFADAMIGCIGKLIADSRKANRFSLPFFVRYAIRLYDGSLINHSSPILIIPSNEENMCPFTIQGEIKYNNDSIAKNATLTLVAESTALKLKILHPDISMWEDLIRSVDIFFSLPIAPYKADPSPDDISYRTSGTGSIRFSGMLPPMRPWDDVLNEIRDNANFYLVKEIPYEDIISGEYADWKEFKTNASWLENLAVREAMTDDFHSHDTYATNAVFSYNSRLNIADISRTAFDGFSLHEMLRYCTREINKEGTLIIQAEETKIVTEIKYNNETVKVLSDSSVTTQPLCREFDHYDEITYIDANDEPSTGNQTYRPGEDTRGDHRPTLPSAIESSNTPRWAWFYYPDRRATKMTILQGIVEYDNNGHQVSIYNKVFEIPLTQHATLNGAYALLRFEDIQDSGTIPRHIDPAIEHLPNMVYLSEVDNPFLFPASHAVPVGNGTIRGISSAIRPLSTGQFGAYPLYAFSTEGIWALDVAATGTYSARQPISREVCTDPSSITQLDASVVFRSDRGLMEISGSNVSCLTEILGHRSPFDITLLPHIDQITPLFGNGTFPLSPIPEFLQECSTIYDHQSARLILFNPLMSYAYVLSLKSQSWGMMQSSLAETFPCYPLTLAIDRQGNVVRFDRDNAPTPPQGLLITRPLKLSQPGIHKTIDTIIQHGDFATGHVSTILYGSNDLRHWFLVHSSRDHRLRGFSGTGYKYFRIALLTNLDPDESIAEALVQFKPRLTNRPR